ncbi:MAG: glycosyltransferase family 2 protein [Lachnoclostridium sp.]|nr:glycosyltransferase family 2 protein [Lachnoclostridium sp.]
MSSEKDILLSIAIPAYNAASTIGRCLESLRSLDLEDVELIVIDDCSTDHTYDTVSTILKNDFTRCHTRLLRNDRNLGSAATRARYMTESRGRYLMQVDADDCLEFNKEDIYHCIATSDADCLVFPFKVFTDGRTKRFDIQHGVNLNSLEISFRNFSLCNKIIRRKFLIDNDLLPYPSLSRWEDLGVTARLLALNPTIKYIDNIYYLYMVDTSRDTLSSFDKERTLHDRMGIARCLNKWFDDQGLAKKYEPFLLTLKFYAKASYLRGRDKDVRAWKEAFPEVNSRIMSLRTIPLHYRLAAKTIALLPSAPVQSLVNLVDRIL